MATLPLLPPNEKQLKHICDDINLTPKQLDKDVEILREWLRMQPHLPQDALDDIMLAGFITGCKNSLQRAKQKIDMYLTNRSLFPEIFGNRDPLLPEFQQSVQTWQMFTLPEMTPEGYRVNICIFIEPDADKYNLNSTLKRALNTADVRLMSDRYQAGEYFIYDLKCVSLMHFTKITPVYMKKFLHCAEDSFPIRQKGIFFINAPPITENCVNTIKYLLKKKIAKKIHITSGDHTEIHKYLPKDILPNEYGGKAGKIEDLHRTWNEYVNSFRDWFLEDAKRSVDESKRPEKSVYTPIQLFGIDVVSIPKILSVSIKGNKSLETRL